MSTDTNMNPVSHEKNEDGDLPQAPYTFSSPNNTSYIPSHDAGHGDKVLEVMETDDNIGRATHQQINAATTTNTTTKVTTDEIDDFSSPPPTTTTSSSSSTPAQSKTPSRLTPKSQKIPSFLLKSSNGGKLTYISMVHEAIVEIGDHRKGSSVPAIQKFMKGKYDSLNSVKPKAFSSMVYSAIKTGLKDERFVKIRNSYKMNTSWVNKKKAAHRAKEVKKKADEKKRRKSIEKAKLDKEKEKKKKEEEEVKKQKQETPVKEEDKEMSEEKKREKEEAKRKKAEADDAARKMAERIRKRRFPMDDLALIAEDKLLGVKRPVDIARQPFMPFTLTSLTNFDDRPPTRKTTSATIANACSATMSPGARPIISDLLQIFHFFRGDVGLFDSSVPKFTFKNLLYATNEILIGNAKKSQFVPLLISQLFYASLKLLTNPDENDWNIKSEDKEENEKWITLKQDLTKLGSSLDEVSWSHTLMCYVDLMDRFYTSDATLNVNALPGYPITLVEEDDEGIKITDKIDSSNSLDVEDGEGDEEKKDLVDGYNGYIGANGPFRRASVKLLKFDPWHLTADEMISVLRVLTDDILSMKPSIAQEFIKRDEESQDLLKAKKAAEYQYRKIRLAYEGPKWPSRSKAKKISTNEAGDKITDENVPNDKDNSTDEKKFIPTATKQEFEAAEKARIKTIEHYEKGMKNLAIRSEPFGYDRNHSAYYFFDHEPDMIHIEVNRNSGKDEFNQSKSWHCIDHKSLFDAFLTSLDVRGVREKALHEYISTHGSSGLKRHLADNNKLSALISARRREEKDFERKLNSALIASADQGRRSGRLASGAKDEVAKIQKEMEIAKNEYELELEIIKSGPDYPTLTGMNTVKDFEDNNDVYTSFSSLVGKNGATSGLVHFISSKILELESHCEELDPWERKDRTRQAWIDKIEDACNAYNTEIVIGPKSKSSSDETTGTPGKRRRISTEPSPSGSKGGQANFSLLQVLAVLRGPLVELEERIYSITGLHDAVNEADCANDNMSVDSDDSNDMSPEEIALKRTEKLQTAWKKKIYSLHGIPTKRASAIREVLISAIAIARKGHFEDVLVDLRNALNLHRPGAAGKARHTALSVLQKYGDIEFDYDAEMQEKEEDDSNADEEVEDGDDSKNDTSYLCTEAMMLTGCLDGDKNADRVDWKEAVLGCRTISRFSALLTALLSKASPKLQKLSDDRHTLSKAIKYWEAGSKTRKSRFQKKAAKDKYHSGTEIWTNTRQTDEFVYGKVEGYPWWPARICVAKDPDVRTSLESLDKVLISFVGEPHLHVVKHSEEIKQFSGKGKENDDIVNYPKEVIANFQESVAMARRILRGKSGSNRNYFVEEKKSSS